jgi:hypothetical protein
MKVMAMDTQTEFAALVNAIMADTGISIEGSEYVSARRYKTDWAIPIFDLTDSQSCAQLSTESYSQLSHDFECMTFLPEVFMVAVSAVGGHRTWHCFESPSGFNPNTPPRGPDKRSVRQYTLGYNPLCTSWWVRNIVGVLRPGVQIDTGFLAKDLHDRTVLRPGGRKLTDDLAAEMVRTTWTLPRIIYWLEHRKVQTITVPSSGMHAAISASRVRKGLSPLGVVKVVSLSAVKRIYTSTNQQGTAGNGSSQVPHTRKATTRTYKKPIKKKGPNQGQYQIEVPAYHAGRGAPRPVITQVVP